MTHYQHVERSGARIAYRVSGSGPALVLMKNNRHPPDYPTATLLDQEGGGWRGAPLEFWQSYWSYDWHHELRNYAGTAMTASLCAHQPFLGRFYGRAVHKVGRQERRDPAAARS